MSESISAKQVMDGFIDKWKNSGGSERSNYQLFLTLFLPVVLALLFSSSTTFAELHLYGSVDNVEIEVTGNKDNKPVYTDAKTGETGYFAQNSEWQLVQEASDSRTDICEYLLAPPRYNLFRERDNLHRIDQRDERMYSVNLHIGNTYFDFGAEISYSELYRFWPRDALKDSVLVLTWINPDQESWNSGIMVIGDIPEYETDEKWHSGYELIVPVKTLPENGFPVLSLLKDGEFVAPDLSRYPLKVYSGGGSLKLVFEDSLAGSYNNEKKDSPLHLAANYGLTDTVERLLEKDKHSKKAKNIPGETPLFSAARAGRGATFNYLFKTARASVQEATEDKNNILHYILYSGHTELLQDLADARKLNTRLVQQPGSAANGPMQIGMRYQRDDAFNLLITKDRSFQGLDKEKVNLLLIQACLKGMSNTAEYLITKKKADPNIRIDGYSPLGRGALHGSANLARRLIDLGAHLENQDQYGNTPLMIAALAGNFSYLKVLFEAGADINHLNKDSATALHFAIFKKHTEIAIYLLENGADPNALTNKGENPVWLASTRGDRESVRQLLMKGAVCNLDEKLALDLMEYAFRWDIPEVVDLALGQCLPADFYFHDTFPARWVAEWYAADDVHEMLVEKGAQTTKPKLPKAKMGDLDERPKVIEGFLPEYPKELQIKYGTVELFVDVIIGPDGSVYFPKLSGQAIPELNESIYKMMEQWRFTEPKSEGQPVYIKSRLPLTLSADPGSEEGAYESSYTDTLPVPIKRVNADPPAGLRRGTIHRVVLHFTVTKDGIVENIEIKEYTDERIIDCIIEAISQWRFEPAYKNGKPINLKVQMPFVVQSR